MSAVVGLVIIAAVAFSIALPLLRPASRPGDVERGSGLRERLGREKHVALLAIKEADFDRAMGKLSPDDYAVLKGDYEERALDAMEKLSKGSAAAAPGGASNELAAYCTACGSAFPPTAAFCPDCGSRRPGTRAA